MDPSSIILIIIKKYWWVLIVIALLVYTSVLRDSIDTKNKEITQRDEKIIELSLEIKSFKTKLDVQNKAIDELTQKGKEQATRLETAIAKVNAMKPATQVIIREIYSDNTKNLEQLLLNAVND